MGDIFDLSEESYLKVLRLLEQRCVEELALRKPSGCTGNIFKTLMESKCSLNHEHSKLTNLYIWKHDVTDEILSTMCEFFRNGHAVCLKELSLLCCEINSRKLSIFCEVLDNKLCPELTFLNLGRNNIADEGLTKLCKTITKEKLLKLTKLGLWDCSLTDDCLPELCNALQHEHCRLNKLDLYQNKFTLKGRKSFGTILKIKTHELCKTRGLQIMSL